MICIIVVYGIFYINGFQISGKRFLNLYFCYIVVVDVIVKIFVFCFVNDDVILIYIMWNYFFQIILYVLVFVSNCILVFYIQVGCFYYCKIIFLEWVFIQVFFVVGQNSFCLFEMFFSVCFIVINDVIIQCQGIVIFCVVSIRKVCVMVNIQCYIIIVDGVRYKLVVVGFFIFFVYV